MRGYETLQIDGVMSVRNREQQNVFGAGRGIENASENRPDEQQAKCFEKSNAGQQQHRWNEVRKVRHQVSQQTLQLAHEALRCACDMASRTQFGRQMLKVRLW